MKRFLLILVALASLGALGATDYAVTSSCTLNANFNVRSHNTANYNLIFQYGWGDPGATNTYKISADYTINAAAFALLGGNDHPILFDLAGHTLHMGANGIFYTVKQEPGSTYDNTKYADFILKDGVWDFDTGSGYLKFLGRWVVSADNDGDSNQRMLLDGATWQCTKSGRQLNAFCATRNSSVTLDYAEVSLVSEAFGLFPRFAGTQNISTNNTLTIRNGSLFTTTSNFYTEYSTNKTGRVTNNDFTLNIEGDENNTDGEDTLFEANAIYLGSTLGGNTMRVSGSKAIVDLNQYLHLGVNDALSQNNKLIVENDASITAPSGINIGHAYGSSNNTVIVNNGHIKTSRIYIGGTWETNSVGKLTQWSGSGNALYLKGSNTTLTCSDYYDVAFHGRDGLFSITDGAAFTNDWDGGYSDFVWPTANGLDGNTIYIENGTFVCNTMLNGSYTDTGTCAVSNRIFVGEGGCFLCDSQYMQTGTNNVLTISNGTMEAHSKWGFYIGYHTDTTPHGSKDEVLEFYGNHPKLRVQNINKDARAHMFNGATLRFVLPDDGNYEEVPFRADVMEISSTKPNGAVKLDIQNTETVRRKLGKLGTSMDITLVQTEAGIVYSGADAQYYSFTNSLPEGVSVISFTPSITIRLEPLYPPIVQVGGVQYMTLQEAFDAAEAGQTVTMIEDAKVEGSLDISEAKTCTFNINGHSLNLSGDLIMGTSETPCEGNPKTLFIPENSSLTLGGTLKCTGSANRVILEGTLECDGETGLAYGCADTSVYPAKARANSFLISSATAQLLTPNAKTNLFSNTRVTLTFDPEHLPTTPAFSATEKCSLDATCSLGVANMEAVIEALTGDAEVPIVACDKKKGATLLGTYRGTQNAELPDAAELHVNEDATEGTLALTYDVIDVMEVDGVNYAKIDSALSAITDNSEAKFLVPLSRFEPIVFHDLVALTVDLNGQTIAGTSEEGVLVFKNIDAILTDSSLTQEGEVVQSENGPAISIEDNAVLNIYGGTYSWEGAGMTINAGTVIDVVNGTLNTEGGVFTAVEGVNHGIYLTEGGVLLDGGDFSAAVPLGRVDETSAFITEGSTATFGSNVSDFCDDTCHAEYSAEVDRFIIVSGPRKQGGQIIIE